MNYEFFENLSASEAQAYFDRYMEIESREIEATLREARTAGIVADFTLDSIAGFFEWIRSQIQGGCRGTGR